jgi:hypothetical protein
MLAVSSARTNDVRDGVNVLQTLLEEEGPKRDYLYFVAQGTCRLRSLFVVIGRVAWNS